MTEPPLSLSAFAARQQHSLNGPLAPPIRYAPRSIDPPGLDGTADEEDDGEIICICAYNWDDGYTIQCETCNKWNHMECYYPNESDRPGPDQTHYCVDCQPREVDARRASALQREKYHEQLRENGSKRPVSKAGRKKAKDSPHPTAPAVNGWSADKHAHLQGGRERKSASPRDQPPPAKRTKISHRSSTASNNTTGGRKRTASTLNHNRSPSKSPGPDTVYGPVIPMCTDEFLHLPETARKHVETNTNIWNSIELTNALSNWLKDPEAVERECQQKQVEVFKRWDGPFDEMPGKPEVSYQTRVDSNFPGNGKPITYPCLTVEQEITQHTFIGELLGHVGFKREYMEDPEGRWESLRHCEPFVFFHPKLPIYIDARQEGSIYRYVRRSCKPNAEMQTIITDSTTYHFCFMATQDILPGEEITVGWEFDERIRAIYAQRSSVSGEGWAPDVKNQIAVWVSNVLANCGPCACSSQSCPMAFFDRRGQAIPIDPEPLPAPAPVPILAPVKAPKSRKRKTAHNLSVDENSVNHINSIINNNNSRSGSEARKADPEEDMTDSRSVSGSYRGSASRDITPGTHYSAVVPELSEREKKKLMREEEMFKKQEEEKGRQRKKRNSGGSNLNTPSANTSRQLGHPTTSRYADAGTSSRNPATSGRTSSSTRRGAKQSTSARSSVKPSIKQPPRPVYVDTAVQCDMDSDETVAPPLVTPPKRKQYLSVTQRLLRRCASNNFKKKAESPAPEDVKVAPPPQGDVMDIDEDESPKPDAETADVLPLSPISDKVKEAEKIDAAVEHPRSAPPLSPAFGNHDAVMKDADDDPERAVSPTQAANSPPKPITSSPALERTRPTSHPPMDPPPPPWPTKSPLTSPSANQQPKASSSSPTLVRPDFNITMPVPSANPFSIAGAAVVQSPSAFPSGLTPTSIFPPSVSAALNPSPIARKKMSLSDYTKRNKAQRHDGDPVSLSHRESSPAMSTVSADLAPREGVVVSVSPAPESIPASSSEAVEKTLDVVAQGTRRPSVAEEEKTKSVAEDMEEGEVGNDAEPDAEAEADADGEVDAESEPVKVTAPVAPVAPMAPMADMVPVPMARSNEPITTAAAHTIPNAAGSAPAPTAPMSSS